MKCADLSRRLTEHERWPCPAPTLNFWPRPGQTWRVRDTGLLWRWVDGAWRLDLDDAATAGVLMALIADRLVGGMAGALRLVRERMEKEPGLTWAHAAASALLALWEVAR